MKKILLSIAVVAALAAVSYLVVQAVPEKYEGVDDTVVGKYAEKAGHPPRKALIDTDKGDLLLFFFLIAGVAGGFVGGYCYRELFAPGNEGVAARKELA
jgi:hypothetical protein